MVTIIDPVWIWKFCETYHEGIIALSCLSGRGGAAYIWPRDCMRKPKDDALEYEEIFGKGNFFLELQDHGIPEQAAGESAAAAHAVRSCASIWWLPTTCIIPMTEDAEAHDILLCLQTGKKLADEDRMRYEGGQYFVKIRRRDDRHCFPMRWRRLKTRRKLQTAAMWRLNSA